MHHILCMFFIATSISEEGYLYSVYGEGFLNYKSIKNESRIFVSKPGKKVKKFEIRELTGDESGSIKIIPIENEEKDIVIDRSGYNGDMIQYKYHGGKNQVWKMAMVPKMMVKLEVDGKCIEAKQDSYYLKAEKCDTFENTPGQYFRWLPEQIVNEMNAEEKKKNTSESQPEYNLSGGEKKEVESQRPKYSLGNPNSGIPEEPRMAPKLSNGYFPEVTVPKQCSPPPRQIPGTTKECGTKGCSSEPRKLGDDDELFEELRRFQKAAIESV